MQVLTCCEPVPSAHVLKVHAGGEEVVGVDAVDLGVGLIAGAHLVPFRISLDVHLTPDILKSIFSLIITCSERRPC